MKKILALVITVAFVALFSIGAQATITTTKHNLSNGGPGTVKASAGQQNDEICIWCHTPHSANIAFTGAPLWNKAAPAAGSYNMYGTTIAGTSTALTPASSSLACLSCHDGASAINSLVMDSAGNVVAGGIDVAFGATAAGNPVTMTGNADLGVDLSNDHPISITYTAGKASLVATTTTFGTGQIGDLLRGAAKDQVECGSCHDPHVAAGDTTAQGTIAGAFFLRESNASSALCLACHAK